MATHEGFDLIEKYFPTLDAGQLEAFRRLGELYPEWNERINVISRRDIEYLYPRHVLHSLSIARFLGTLPADIEILDLGTGGGFPGIPLAIAYPQCRFLLLDRIAKKLKVASEIASELGLKNVRFQHGDAGECHSKCRTWNMARILKIMENEKHPLDDRKNDEITEKREK